MSINIVLNKLLVLLYALMLVGCQITSNIFITSNSLSYYLFFICSAFIFLCYTAWGFLNKVNIHLNSTLICFGIFSLWLSATNFGSILSTNTLLLIILGFFHFIVLISIMRNGQSYLTPKILLFLLVISAFIQVFVSYLQWIGVVSNLNQFFLVGGLLGNPNVLSIGLTLVAIFTVGVLLLSNSLKKIEYTVLSCYLIFSLPLIVITSCRTAWIMLATGAFCLLYFKYSQQIKGLGKKYVVLIVVLTLVITYGFVVFLYGYKKTSTDSRMHIWENTLSMIKENPILGHGYANFERDYNIYQVKKFYNMPEEQRDYSKGGFVEMAFNDFIEIGAKSGIFGLVLYLAIIVLTFFLFCRRYRKNNLRNSPFFITAICILISYTVGSLFNYMVIIPFNLFIFIFIISLVSHKTAPLFQIRQPKLFPILFSIVAIVVLLFTIQEVSDDLFLKKMMSADKTCLEKNKEKISQISTKNIDGKKLYACANLLNKINQKKEAFSIIQRAKTKSSHPSIYVASAKLQIARQNFEQAESDYLIALGIQPYKLSTRYELLRLYDRVGKKTHALNQAHIILKVQARGSEIRAREIKELANEYLDIHDVRH